MRRYGGWRFALRWNDQREVLGIFENIGGQRAPLSDYALRARPAMALLGPSDFARVLRSPEGWWVRLELVTEQRYYDRRKVYPLIATLETWGRANHRVLLHADGIILGNWCTGGFKRITGLRPRRAYYGHIILVEKLAVPA